MFTPKCDLFSLLSLFEVLLLLFGKFWGFFPSYFYIRCLCYTVPLFKDFSSFPIVRTVISVSPGATSPCSSPHSLTERDVLSVPLDVKSVGCAALAVCLPCCLRASPLLSSAVIFTLSERSVQLHALCHAYLSSFSLNATVKYASWSP